MKTTEQILEYLKIRFEQLQEKVPYSDETVCRYKELSELEKFIMGDE